MVAHKFGLDPVLVLKGNYFDLAIRVAAANYVSRLEAEANKKSAQQNHSGKVPPPDWIG